MNYAKLKQLGANSIIPGAGVGIVMCLAFGFAWWTIPLALLIGGATSLAITKPQKALMTNKMLALKEAELDKKLAMDTFINGNYNKNYFLMSGHNFDPHDLDPYKS